jgi:hypothetical protein
MSRSLFYLLGMSIFILAACTPSGSLSNQPGETASPISTATITPEWFADMTATPWPPYTETPIYPAESAPAAEDTASGPTPSMTATQGSASPTAQPDATIIAPLASVSGGILHVEWSPDSRWITYFDLEAKAGHVLNVETEQDCVFTEIPQADDYWCYGCDSAGPTLYTWQRDGRIFLIDQGTPTLITPCGGSTSITSRFTSSLEWIESVSPDGRMLVLRTEDGSVIYDSQTQRVVPIALDLGEQRIGIAWSPGGTQIALSTDEAGEAVTWTVNLQSGQAKEMLRWNSRPSPGPCCTDLHWLDESLFFVDDADRGLLLVISEGTARLDSALFGIKLCEPEACAYLPHAQVHADRASGSYHVLLSQGQSRLPYLLYHSETGEIETLPEGYDYEFPSDARWIAARRSDGENYIRPIDPQNAGLQKHTLPSDTSRVYYTAEGDIYALSDDSGVFSIYSADNALLGSWWSEGFSSWQFIWSPDQRRVALIGDAGASGIGLFVVAMP